MLRAWYAAQGMKAPAAVTVYPTKPRAVAPTESDSERSTSSMLATFAAACSLAPIVPGSVMSSGERRLEKQRQRRHDVFMVNQVIEKTDVDVAAADYIVAELLKTPSGRKQCPKAAEVLQGRVTSVKEDALAKVDQLTSGLQTYSRYRKTIVKGLTQPSESFSTADILRGCSVSSSYARVARHRAAKKSVPESHPLWDESLRGYPTNDRDSCCQLEYDTIVDWARQELVVRSGTHTERFRLNDRKLKVYENFQAAYPRLLRQMHRKDNLLSGSLLSQKPITIFQRNVQRALWLSRQAGFEEGAKADEEERSRLKRRIATEWKRGKLPPQTVAEFDPSQWEIVYRCSNWFWTTLHDEGLRFRRDYTPYECAICVSNVDKELELTKGALASMRDARAAGHANREEGKELECPDGLQVHIDALEGKMRRLQKRAQNLRSHKLQVGVQRKYNMAGGPVDDWLMESARRVRVTTDFGASYFIDGTRYVCLIFYLKYKNQYGDFSCETLYSTVSDPDQRSEDAFFTRAVWDHMLRTDGKGAGIFERFDEIKLLRDSGPHFQNNAICYFESTISQLYGKMFTVSAFAKRHGWNECDGAMARFVGAINDASLEGAPPLDAQAAVNRINFHDRFFTCSAFYFAKIDRNPALFPKVTQFKGIQSLSLCEFKYTWTDFDGREVSEPGWVLARHRSGQGPWFFHDFLSKTRDPAWGKRCKDCSNQRARAVYHKREGEPVKGCRLGANPVLNQPDASEVDPALQPVPRSQRANQDVGQDAVRCNWCPPDWRTFKESGIKRHHNAAHEGKVLSYTRVHPLPAEGAAGGEAAAGNGAERARGRGARGGARGLGSVRGRGRGRGASGRGRGGGVGEGPGGGGEEREAGVRRGRKRRAPLPPSVSVLSSEDEESEEWRMELSSDEEGWRSHGVRSRVGERVHGDDEKEEESEEKTVEEKEAEVFEEDFGLNFAGLQIYEVDEIVGERGEGDDLFYKATWKPSGVYPPSWEHHSNFSGCVDALRAWNDKK